MVRDQWVCYRINEVFIEENWLLVRSKRGKNPHLSCLILCKKTSIFFLRCVFALLLLAPPLLVQPILSYDDSLYIRRVAIQIRIHEQDWDIQRIHEPRLVLPLFLLHRLHVWSIKTIHGWILIFVIIRNLYSSSHHNLASWNNHEFV